jgi:hypothetical protein
MHAHNRPKARLVIAIRVALHCTFEAEMRYERVIVVAFHGHNR